MAREKFHPPEQQAPSKAVASSPPLPTPVVEQVREDRDGQTSGGPEPEEEEFHGPHGPSLDDMKKFMKEGE